MNDLRCWLNVVKRLDEQRAMAMPPWFIDGRVISGDDLDRFDASEFIEGDEFDYEWRFCRVPVSLLRHAILSDADIADMDRQEPGRMDSVRDMVRQGKMLERPVVLLLTTNGSIYVLDGFHRITASIEANLSEVYAVVGRGDPLA